MAQPHSKGDICALEEVPTSEISKDQTDVKIQLDEAGFEENAEKLGRSYFLTSSFIGSFLAIGLGFWAGNAGFAYTGPILPIINADLGPDPSVQWVALVHPVGLSIGMTIVGRLGDLFGRRWFFIGGAFMALVGTLISALAVNLNMLIVGAMIKALAASTQLSVYYAMVSLQS
jgi:MFS family permease